MAVSALRAGRPFLPARFLVLITVRGWADLRAIVQLEKIRSIEKSNDLIGKRTRELPALRVTKVKGESALVFNYLSTRPWRFKWSGDLLHLFSTSALDRSECSVSWLGRFIPPEKSAHVTNLIGGWVGPRAGVDTLEKKKISCLLGNWTPTFRSFSSLSETLYRLWYQTY
jgi:hypothetical protein